MKNILLPTDFSLNAQNAISYAISLFKDEKCNFFIMNAFQVNSSGLMTKIGSSNNTRLFQILKEESESELKKVAKHLRETDPNPNHQFKTLSIPDHLTNAIAKIIHSKKIDCVIMGAKNASGLNEVFWGSNTYKTMKSINFCPIIAVPNCYENFKSMETIVLATGYEHLFEAYELKPLIHLAQLFNSEIWITYIGNLNRLSPKQKEAKETLQQCLKPVKHSFIEVEKGSSISNTINRMVKENRKIDMVAMLDSAHSFFEKLTREAIVRKVFFNIQVPFLMMPFFKQENTAVRKGLKSPIAWPFLSKQTHTNARA